MEGKDNGRKQKSEPEQKQPGNDSDLDDESFYRKRINAPTNDLELRNDESKPDTESRRARSNPVLPIEKQIIIRKSLNKDLQAKKSIQRSVKEGPNQPIANEEDILTMYTSKSLEHFRLDKNRVSSEPGLSPHSLYKEALYTGLHMLGRPTERFICTSEDLCMYAHLAFPVNHQEQMSVVEHVMGEPFPLTIVNTRLKRAEGLPARELSGESNPYCLVALETLESISNQNWQNVSYGSPLKPSESSRRLAEKRLDQLYLELPKYIKTSIQYSTPNPVWDQRFQCLGLRPSADLFTIEVWDHDDEKSTLHSIKQAKDAKKAQVVVPGMEQLDDAFYRGKRDNFLGRFTVKIQDIPCDGEEIWYNLGGITHRGIAAKGKVLLQMWLSHAYRHGRHYDHYAAPKITLACMWDYILDLESKKYEGATNWDGIIPPAATCLLFQYALQTGISESSQGLIRWMAYEKHSLGLHGIASSLADLKTTVTKASDEKLEDWKVSEIETSMFIIAIEKLCPILRNHLLGETQARVQLAVEAIQHCIGVLKRFKSIQPVHHINVLVKTYLRLGVLDWYEATFKKVVTEHYGKSITDYDLIHLYVEMVRQVNMILDEGNVKWSVLFWMEGFIDYMPLMYTELQKMMIFDVEEISWRLTWRTFSNNNKLRFTLLRLNDADTKLCQYLYELYHETQLFVQRPDKVPSIGGEVFNFFGAYAEIQRYSSLLSVATQEFKSLLEYQQWFRPVLVLWLGFAFVKSCKMIARSIMVDSVVAQDEFVKTSSSSLDTRVVFSQLASFWTELNWPDPAENYVVVHFLVEVLSHVGVLYAILKTKKIEKEGSFDTGYRFDITERLCVALNNIETVKIALVKTFNSFNTNNLMTQLETSLGQIETIKYQNDIQKMIDESTGAIDKEVDKILDGVKIRLKPEIRVNIDEYLIRLSKNPNLNPDEGLEKLYTYLEEMFIKLQENLLPTIFVPVLQVFWKAICEELVEAVQHFPLNESAFEQKEFFGHLEDVLQALMNYFRGSGGIGLTDEYIRCDEYLTAEQFITLFQWETQALVGLYFNAKAREQFLPHPPKFGTLLTRCSFWNGTLNVEVISAKNLIGSDPDVSQFCSCKKNSRLKATSDCLVQLELVPEKIFFNNKRQETTTKWSTVNPVFDESFSWQVTIGECRQPNAVLRFTVKDYDLVSKNDFLGEAFVPIDQLPGVREGGILSQPMTLHLRSKDDNNTTRNIIQILKCRRWDPDAKVFLTDEEERIIKPLEP